MNIFKELHGKLDEMIFKHCDVELNIPASWTKGCQKNCDQVMDTIWGFITIPYHKVLQASALSVL